jgi:aryl-alcohol dehydrogenase (NADP+)
MYQRRYWHPHMFQVVDRVGELAKDMGCTPAQLALAWLLAQPGVTAPIVGASRPDQLDETVKAVEVKIPNSALEALNHISEPFR